MPSSLNKVMLIGRLGRDPEMRSTQGGVSVANLSLATDESFKDRSGQRQDRTEWHTVVLWGKQAEIAEQYLRKGRLVFVEGRIETRKWKDKEGHDRYSTQIRAFNFQMLDSGGGRDESPGPPPEEDGPLLDDESDVPF